MAFPVLVKTAMKFGANACFQSKSKDFAKTNPISVKFFRQIFRHIFEEIFLRRARKGECAPMRNN